MLNSPTTFSTKLTLWYGITFFLFLLISFCILYFSVDAVLESEIKEDLIEDIAEFRSLYNEDGLDEIKREIRNESATEDSNDEFIRLLSLDGEELISTNLENWKGLYAFDTKLKRAAEIHPEPIVETIKLANHDYHSKVAYALIADKYILQIGESTENKSDLMEIIALSLAPLLFIAIPFASLICWKIAKHTTKDIEQVSKTASLLESGDFSQRVKIGTNVREVASLGISFNNMAERVQTLITEMREMIDNIAHDLRSPIGRIRAISEDSISNNNNLEEYKVASAQTLEECDRLITMINTTLDVAEAESGVSNEHHEKVNISNIVEEVCDLFEPLAESKNIRLIATVQPNKIISGNKQNLQRMISNMIDNAIKYTGKNGEIIVDVINNEKEIKIFIKDTGIGIPGDEVDRIFDRFYRCDSSRSNEGCGLGLSFARAVARSHNGDIQIESEVNKGSIFTIMLPY